MAINKRKILESAQKNLQKGLLDKALEDYRTLLKADPHDSNVLLKLGDLYLKQGKRDESINAYLRVAQQFTREGFDAKAVALYKQISRLDPKRHDVCVPLAELYARMGLVSDAIASLQTAADAAYRAGDKDGALELLRRMAALDPSNTPNRLKVAELLAQEGRRDEALTEYQAVTDELERRGEEEERIRVLERILAVEPERASALREVARAKLATSQFAAARKLAEALVAAHPEDVDGAEILGHALLGAGETERAREVFRELAERFRLRGDEDRARDLMQRFGGLEALAPDEGEALEPGADGPLEAAPPLESDAGGGLLELDDELGADDEFLLDDEPLVLEAPAPPPPKAVPVGKIEPVQALKRAPRAEAKAPPAAPAPAKAPPAAPAPAKAPPAARAPAVEPESADPGQLLAEATVYARYGKHERAVGVLRAILAREPGHQAALEQLGAAFAALGDAPNAATAWQRAAEAAHAAGDAGAFERVRAQLATVDAEAAAELAPPTAPAAPPPSAHAAPPPSAHAAPPPSAHAAGEISLDDVEIDLDLDGGFESEEPAPDPEPPSLELGAAGELDLSADESAPRDPAAWPQDDLLDDVLGDASAEAAPEPGEAALPAGEGPTATTPAQLAEQLEEAEFYLEQGMLDEACALYEGIVAAAPNHPQAMLRLGEIAARRAAPAAAPAPRVAPEAPVEAVAPAPAAAQTGGTEDFDIGSEIELDFDDSGDATPQAAPAAPEREPAAAPEPTTAPEATAAPQPAGDFDLAAELSFGFGAEEPAVRTLAGTEEEGFEQVFSAFKSGVERELGEGDHEARYDLGIAYKEMGLLEDAIGEFRIAMQSEARRLSCLHMMGLCALELGRSADAVAHLEQALSLPDLPDELRVPLRYDLARAYAAQGDVARARAAFEEVRALDPGFGDVERELAALEQRGEGPSDGEEREPGEAYESFDDLLAESPQAPATPRYESFDDLFADTDETPEAAPEPDEPRAVGTPEPAPELTAREPMAPQPAAAERAAAEPAAEPATAEAAPEPASESAPAPETASARKRRKISFV